MRKPLQLRFQRAFLAIAVGAALCATALVAEADTAADFKRAIDLFQAKNCPAALPLFEGIVSETGSPNARIYVARCLRDAGRLDEAYEQMRLTVSDATQKAESEAKYEPTRDSAAAELALLEPKVGKLVVAIVDTPDGVTVQIGSRALRDEQIGVPIAVMPGTLELVADARGMATITREIEVEAGKTRTLTLSFEPATDDDAEEDDDDDEPDDGVSSPVDGLAIAGYVLTGVGVVGLGVGAGLAAKAQSDFDALAEECGNATCPADEQARVDDGRKLTTIANASLIAGGVVAAAGITLVVYSTLNEDSGDGAHLELVPTVGPWQHGLSLTGRF
jgi:hypothetical protein